MRVKVFAAVCAVVFAIVVSGCEVTDDSASNGSKVQETVSVSEHSPQVAAVKAGFEPADNSFCYVCHANFQGEKVSFTHEVAGVGCTTCHGPSGGHGSDEDGLKPPDIMFAKEKIDPACKNCHPTANSHPPKNCTDCHGNHLMPSRTRRWNKDTRELIWDDGVRTDLQTIYGEDKPLVN